MPLDFGQSNDEQVVYQFLMENGAEEPIGLERVQRLKAILAQACPDKPPEQETVGSLLCFDMQVDEQTQSKLSVIAGIMIDEWNNSLAVIRKGNVIADFATEIKQLHLALHIIRMQEFLETEPDENPAIEYNRALGAQHNADFILKRMGDVKSPELEGMYREHYRQVSYRITDAMLRGQGRSPPPRPGALR